MKQRAAIELPQGINPLTSAPIKPVELLQQLVKIPSFAGTSICQRLVAETMLSVGLDITQFTSASVPESAATNVIGILRGKAPQAGRSLMLVSHADTVPPEPLNRWMHAPFDGIISDGKMYGRGVYDDKAGIALMLAVADTLTRSGKTPIGDVIFASIADDESSGNSLKQLTDNGISPDACLMLDGAKLHQLTYAHPGCLWYRLSVIGTTTACSNKAANAVDKSILILNELMNLAEQLNKQVEGTYKIYGKPIRLNICKIQGGEWLGNNAACCETEFSLNFVPPENIASVKTAIEHIVTQVAINDEWLCSHSPTLEPIYMAFDPYESSLDSPFYKTVAKAHKRATGFDLEPRVITGWFHGPAIPCPTFLYGPGDGGNSHGANEFFDLKSFDVLTLALMEIIQDWVGLE